MSVSGQQFHDRSLYTKDLEGAAPRQLHKEKQIFRPQGELKYFCKSDS
jgi:hypothetical protein